MTAGVAGLAAVNQHRLYLGLALSILPGLGVGGLIQPAVTMLTIISPDSLLATISAASISIRLVGASIGYAVYFNIFQTKVSALSENVGIAVAKAGLPQNEIPGFLGALLTQNVTALAQFPASVTVAGQEAAIDTYTVGFRTVYLASIAFGAIAIILSLFVKDIRKYMVDRVAVDIS